ncbi:ribonuclease H-like domain-containing protein [Tanacetum coccineum]
MIGNMCYLDEYEDYDGGFVSFGDVRGIIFWVKNNVLFTNTECLVLSSDFKLLDESQVLLRVPRKDNIYSVDLKSVVPIGGLTCLIAKATIDESNTWHMRLGHINFKTMNKLVKGNLVKVAAGNKSNGIAGTKDNIVAGQAQKEKEPEQDYILIPLCTTDPLGHKECEGDAGMKPTEVDENQALDKSGKHDQEARSESERLNQREMQTEHTNSSNGINTVSTARPSFDTAVPSTPINTVGPSVSTANESEEQLFERFSPFKNTFTLPPVPNVSSMDNTGIFGNAYDDEDVEEEVDMNNVISSYTVPDTSFTKFHKDHPKDQVIGSLKTPV